MQEKIEETFDHVKEYVKTQYELAVLKTTHKASQVISGMLAGAIFAIISGLAFILLSFGIAFYISETIGNTYSGFFFVGGAYLVIALIILAFKKRLIEKPVENKLIQNFLKEVN